MQSYILAHGTAVLPANDNNESRLQHVDIVVADGVIADIIPSGQPIPQQYSHLPIKEEKDCYVLPGVVDTHVHFRDPGFPEKGTIATESRAALKGGVTTVIDMPNTKPQTTTLQALEEKEQNAKENSAVKMFFMLGATNDNIEELLQIDPSRYAAIKLFMGSSTGNMLVDDPERLELLFKESKQLIVAHCEEERVVQANLANFKAECEGTDKECAALHPQIRNREACFLSTYRAVGLARKYNTRLHVAHISTATELDLFSNLPLAQKRITAEVTPNHLWFDDRDYATLGNKIKCNPAIKSNDDRLALWAALYDGIIDTIGTDHAPHTLAEKQRPYFSAPGGIPSIQHSLQMMLEGIFHNGLEDGEREEFIQTWLPLVCDKMCGNPAQIFGLNDRGSIAVGKAADLVVVRPDVEDIVTRESLLYRCGWSPLEGTTFHTRIEETLIAK